MEMYRRAWVSDGYTSTEEEARYRQLGAEILGRYWETVRADPPSPVAVEEHLEASWDGVPVHGYIDRVDRTPEGGLRSSITRPAESFPRPTRGSPTSSDSTRSSCARTSRTRWSGSPSTTCAR